MHRNRRSLWLIPLVIIFCSLLGGLYGPGLEGASAANASEDDIQASLKSFTKVYNLVEENFADPPNPDKAIYRGAIPGMLRTLDPHSTFFDPRDFQLLREDQKGHYYGVGMTIQQRNSKTIVVAPFTGSPAYKAGIRPGDVIYSVNDKVAENLTSTEVADLLKGPRGTEVKVVILRGESTNPITFKIIRDEIPRKSVQDCFWIRPGIAYLDIDQFNENTSHEVDDGIQKLGESNIKGMILDLRGNPGGLLNEGVAVADRFLEKGQAIVSHRGRASAEKKYTAKRGNGGHDYPMVVLVNRGSASAAEIVSGALQDHDRAWIFGENTFGKGLVQTVYPLSGNSGTDSTGLALTTAKYYTPSGRLIQRDYSHISFFDYYFNRKDADSKNSLDVKVTDSGRTVYGGGGITPDEKYVAPKLTPFQTSIYRKDGFFNFTSQYFGSHDTKLARDWNPDQKLLEEFRQFLTKQGVTATDADFAENADWLKAQLKHEMFISAFGSNEAHRIDMISDPEVSKGIDSLPKAKALLDSVKKIVAQRRTK
jgi:carboxyl-terminal processing protease